MAKRYFVVHFYDGSPITEPIGFGPWPDLAMMEQAKREWLADPCVSHVTDHAEDPGVAWLQSPFTPLGPWDVRLARLRYLRAKRDRPPPGPGVTGKRPPRPVEPVGRDRGPGWFFWRGKWRRS